jgi:membrane-associated phospholipid phosphatase
MQSRAAFYRTISLIFLLCVGVFSWLAWQVQSRGEIVHVDQRVAETLHESAGPWGIFGLKIFTFFGEFAALTTLAVLATAILVRARAHGLAAGWVCAMIGTGVLNEALKRAFARPRPSFAEPIVIASGFSFPSGHSMGTMVATTMLAYAAFRWVSAVKWRRITVAFAITWTLTMGFSRMYLGVHYLSDVIAGFAAGGAWACICMAALERFKQAAIEKGDR